MAFEKAAAFAFADIDLRGYIFQKDFFLVVIVQIGEDHKETFAVPEDGRKRLALGFCVRVECKPDLGQEDLDLKIVALGHFPG